MKRIAVLAVFASMFLAVIATLCAVRFNLKGTTSPLPESVLLLDGVGDDPEPDIVYPAKAIMLGVEDDPEPDIVYPGKVIMLGVEDDPEPDIVYPGKVISLGVENDPEPDIVYPKPLMML